MNLSNDIQIGKLNQILIELDLNQIEDAIIQLQVDLDRKSEPIIVNGKKSTREYEQEKINQLIRIRNASVKIRELIIAEESFRKGNGIPNLSQVEIEPIKRKQVKPERQRPEERTRIIDMTD